MAYQMERDVGLSEYAVSRAIKELQEMRDTFTLDDIARHIGCSVPTVCMAYRKLERASIVRREGSPRHGYRYEYLGDN